MGAPRLLRLVHQNRRTLFLALGLIGSVFGLVALVDPVLFWKEVVNFGEVEDSLMVRMLAWQQFAVAAMTVLMASSPHRDPARNPVAVITLGFSRIGAIAVYSWTLIQGDMNLWLLAITLLEVIVVGIVLSYGRYLLYKQDGRAKMFDSIVTLFDMEDEEDDEEDDSYDSYDLDYDYDDYGDYVDSEDEDEDDEDDDYDDEAEAAFFKDEDGNLYVEVDGEIVPVEDEEIDSEEYGAK